MIFVQALIVLASFLFGIVSIGFYTLRKKRDRDRVGVFIGVSLIVLVTLFWLWVTTYFLAFRAD